MLVNYSTNIYEVYYDTVFSHSNFRQGKISVQVYSNNDKFPVLYSSHQAGSNPI